MSNKDIINAIAYKFYEIRTKDPDNNPLTGYGDSNRDYEYACRVVKSFLDNKLNNDDKELFGDILTKGYNE